MGNQTVAGGQLVNIAAYRFAPLRNLKRVRSDLQAWGKAWGLKGSIVLSPEGIHFTVAGGAEENERLLQRLRAIEGLENLSPKVSQSAGPPFRRLLVRIKKEIVSLEVEGVDAAHKTAPKILPEALKTWLDEGREFTLLDLRNDFEIRLGTFEKAVPIGVQRFRDFPEAARFLPSNLQQKPIVLFCTEGIRCEKAGAFLSKEGFKNVLQLDGGILGYFEKVGRSHFRGDCFVFDPRVCLDAQLQRTADAQCLACSTPLTDEEQKDDTYEEGRSCRYCVPSSEEKRREAMAVRQRALADLTKTLPGSEPYDQVRPIRIPAKYDGESLLDFLTRKFRHTTRGFWQEEIDQKRIFNADQKPVRAEQVVRVGERYFRLSTGESEPPVNPDVRLLYEDEAIVVLEKPAPLPVHPCGRFNRNTLQCFLESVYAPQKPHIAHRLDADTTGLMVVARTKPFASRLQPQFAQGHVHKTYLARVQGHPLEDRFFCDLALSDGLSANGKREAAPDGLAARTEFTVLKRFEDGTALLDVRPITGRTNQIRIHLWELGFPICGDPIYLPHRQLGKVQSKTVSDSPLCLHSKSLEFFHPASQKRMKFEKADVEWAK